MAKKITDLPEITDLDKDVDTFVVQDTTVGGTVHTTAQGLGDSVENTEMKLDYCFVEKTANTAIAQNIWTQMEDWTEYDNPNGWAVSGGQITIPKDGMYAIFASASMQPISVRYSRFIISIACNAYTLPADFNNQPKTIVTFVSSDDRFMACRDIQNINFFNAGDDISMNIFQDGTANTMNSGYVYNTRTFIRIVRLSD